MFGTRTDEVKPCRCFLQPHFLDLHLVHTVKATLSDVGPFIAGYLSMTGPEGWRWLFWVLTIFGGVSTIVLFFTLPETYAPILLRNKAEKVRAETGDTLVYAAIESEDHRILKLLKITLSRPFQLLFGDIIIFLVCLYLSFCYGVQYLFFQVSIYEIILI
jgi:MFS family permease